MSAGRVVQVAEPVPGASAAHALAVRFYAAHIGQLDVFFVDGGLVGVYDPVALGGRLAEVGVFDHAAGGVV